MKFFIVALALVMMAQIAMTQQYVTLSTATVNNNQLIRDLRDLGADYVAQQGVFVSTKAPFRGNFYEITRTEKVERAITASVTYYRYTVVLADQDNLTVARATYVVNYRPSTSNFIVSSYVYRLIGGNPNNEPSVGGPSLVDIRGLNAGNVELSPFLDMSIRSAVEDSIYFGTLPRADYSLKYVYNAYLASSGYPAEYFFLVKLVNDKGDYYRLKIRNWDNSDSEGPSYVPEVVVYPNA